MYEVILFDLDGTVTDPGEGITNSVIYALDKFDIKVEDRSQLYKFIGPPLRDSFAEFYHFDEAKCEQAVAYYREYYKDRGIYENKLYDGMEQLLKDIKESGRKIALATSKPEPFAKQILQYFHIDSYFDVIAGSTLDNTRSSKEEVIAYALKECGVADFRNMMDITAFILKYRGMKDLSQVVMIGDRKYDILGAKKMGIDSIGVLFGYGEEKELRDAGATHIAARVEDIFGLL